MNTPMKVLLFDIDGTLLLSGGAGLRSMSRAFEELFGEANAFEGVNLAGRTDTSIIRDALEKYHIPFTEGNVEAFKNRYYEILETEMNRAGDGKSLMPGVRELLRELRRRPEIYLGLLTGNWEKSGRMKLAHFGLDDYFPFGAFADDAELRDELLPHALRRFERRFGLSVVPEQVYVIGDTPADIRCARPHGARAVAVAAAHYSAEQLLEHEPDYLFEDLTRTDEILKVIG